MKACCEADPYAIAPNYIGVSAGTVGGRGGGGRQRRYYQGGGVKEIRSQSGANLKGKLKREKSVRLTCYNFWNRGRQ